MHLAKEFDLKKIEGEIKKHLENIDVEKLIFESKEKSQKIMFIEGPPTMNGIPHAGHLRGRVFKDLWYRFNTLQGRKIVFNAGWDAQGLPVELQAEKELGVTGGKNEILEKVGIEKLVSECKRVVQKFNVEWVKTDKLLGMSFNQEKAYWTYKDEFIEREWQFLKKASDNKILEKDFTVIAYCPGCQTSLSHSEVNQGYEEVKDPSLYYKVKLDFFPKLEDQDIFLIVWTTMPFTLVTDAMIGFNPDEEYVQVEVKDEKFKDEIWIVGKTRLKDFMMEVKVEEYSVIKTIKGSEMDGRKYIHPLLDKIPQLKTYSGTSKFHIAVSEEFVDVNTGSGIVHLSPANGEEDFKIHKKRKILVFQNPIDDEARFTKDAGDYEGLFVRDADAVIVKDLDAKGAVVKIGKIKHSYPLCWRSHHRIVWLARAGWFYKMDNLGDKAIKAAENVEYFFEQPKNRFLRIIQEKHPWCISRERFWGCPLPFWRCSDCKKYSKFYTREEIIHAATELPDGEDFELHMPWIDRIKIKCQHCDSTNTVREPYVLDTWHNSGAAPYSSLTDEEYNKTIPAPFFTEGIDQTRGWAYTLLIENVILNNSPTAPYKSFLFQGHVLDKNGSKMSKSHGNVIDAQQLLTKYPADLVRFYFMWKSSPIESLSFSTDELMSRPYQVLSTLYHLHLYFKQNSEYDNFDEGVASLNWAIDNKLIYSPDVWILSKLQKLISKVTESNDRCKFHEAAKALDDFIINLLSQVYIPITRGELWEESELKKNRRYAIYAVLSKILKTLDILMHPLCPFTTEYMHHSTFGKKQSVLLESWPTLDEKLVNDSIEESFDLLKESVSVSSAARMKGKLKRRWPLNEAIICVEKNQKEKLNSLSELLLSQLNVENCKIFELEHFGGLEMLKELQQFKLPVIPKLELERKKIGPKVKQHMGELVKKFNETDPEAITNSLVQDGNFTFKINETSIILDTDDFVIDVDVKDGFAFSKRENIIVIISIKRNQELMAQGLVKDIARRLQTLRKERGYNPTDILNVASILDLDSESLEMVKEKSKDLAFLVRAKEVNFTNSCKEYIDEDVDGQKIRISIE